MKWNPKFEIGIESIDEQHRTFISKINELGLLTKTTNPTMSQAMFVVDLVDYIETYAQTHFRHEEDCMHRHGCAAHESNLHAHREFTEKYVEFKRKWIASGYSVEMLAELHRMSSEWIGQHILKIDMELKQCLPGKPRDEAG